MNDHKHVPIQHGHGRHEHGHGDGYEHRDLTARSVLGFLVGVTVFLLASYLVVVGVYSFLNRYERTHQPVQNPLAQTSSADTRVPTVKDIKQFPQPQLEEVERQNLDQARIKEEGVLNSYGWVDEKAGSVHIPIERAMQLVEQRGLPVRPQGGTAAASDATGAKKKDNKNKTGGRP